MAPRSHERSEFCVNLTGNIAFSNCLARERQHCHGRWLDSSKTPAVLACLAATGNDLGVRRFPPRVNGMFFSGRLVASCQCDRTIASRSRVDEGRCGVRGVHGRAQTPRRT